jgi:hypothetical protein
MKANDELPTGLTRYPPLARPSNLRSQIEVVIDKRLAEDFDTLNITTPPSDFKKSVISIGYKSLPPLL